MGVRQANSAIGIRELEADARGVLRRVKDGEIIDVADGDSIVARLVPVEPNIDPEALAAWWNRHDELVEEIDQHWPEGVSAADAIADVRREL